jgi:hypothetical protein
MVRFFQLGAATAFGFVLVLSPGCEPAEPIVVPGTLSTAEDGDHDDHEHAHAAEGPHGGSIVELGTEEYHAELVHDEASKTVTVFILDASATKAAPIDATEVVINLTHEGEGEQFKLAASSDSADPAGSSSRFASADPELAEELDHAHGGATLVVTVAGKQYRGELAHDHDHEGHSH